MQTDETVPTEIELKLRLAPGAADALARAFARTPAATRHETTQYFDTPDFALEAHGLTLRVRTSGARRIQTLKTAASSGGAASRRGEWEWPIDQATPLLDRLAGTPAAGMALENLAAVVTTRITRDARILRPDADTEIEAAHDRGTIAAAGAETAVDELELELKRGAPVALFDLALALHATVPMRLDPESKSARGYRLLHGVAPAAVPIPEGRLSVARCLGAILANVAAAEAGVPDGLCAIAAGLARLRATPHPFVAAIDRILAEPARIAATLHDPEFTAMVLGLAAWAERSGPPA